MGVIDRFQTDDGVKVLLVSLQAGGVGINLTAATHVIHFDRCYNPAKENQATDRAHRIGQNSVVTVHVLQCAGTFEERLNDIMSEKRAIAKDFNTMDGNWIQDYSDDQIRDLFALDPEPKRCNAKRARR